MIIEREIWFKKKWSVLQKSLLAAVPGITCFIIAVQPQEEIAALIAIGIMLCIPLILCIILIPIYHWKERYIGDNSNIWGALLVLESWFKIIYWFRHIYPDWRNSGRYTEYK